MRQTCHNVGTAGGEGYPNLGPPLCTVHGISQIGPAGRSYFKPCPGTTPLGAPCHAPPEVRRPYTSVDLLGGEGVGGGRGGLGVPLRYPLLPRVEPADGSSGTPLLSPPHTQDSGRAGVVVLNRYSHNPSHGGLRPLRSGLLWCDRV